MMNSQRKPFSQYLYTSRELLIKSEKCFICGKKILLRGGCDYKFGNLYMGELLRHGFEELGMSIIWCGYYEGNMKSKRVQEKVGFVYHHTCNDVPVPLMGETRIGYTNYMTREQWETYR